MPEKSSSTLAVQHGGLGDATLAVQMQPEELCLKASEGLDRQALGLVSHLRTDSQPSTENLGSEKGTLCATDPRFNLEGSQQNASMTQAQICTREEQIKQSYGNVYPVAVNVNEKGDFFVTGSNASSSIPSGVANKYELQKAVLPSEMTEALKGTESALRPQGPGEVKALESEAMEVLEYSEASLKSMAQGGVKELETTSGSVSLTSDVTTIPKSADLDTVKAAHMSVDMEEVKVTGATALGGVSRTLEPALNPPVLSDNLRVAQCSSMESSSVLAAAVEPVGMMADMKSKTDPDAALQHSLKTQMEMKSAKILLAAGEGTPDSATAFLQAKVFTETRGLTDAHVVAETKGLQATSEPVAAVQTLIPRTVPEIQMVEGFQGPRATMEVVTGTRTKDTETGQATLQLENTYASKTSESESNMRGLEATPLSLQKEEMKGPAGVLRPMTVVESKTLGATSPSLQIGVTKASEDLGDPESAGRAKMKTLEAVLQPGALVGAMGLGGSVYSEAKTGSTVLEANSGRLAVEGRSERTSESVIAHVRKEPVTEMMHVAVGEMKNLEVATSSAITQVRGLDSLTQVEAVAEVKGAEASSKTSGLIQMKNLEMAVGSETRTLMQDRGTNLIPEVEDMNKAKMSKEVVLEPVQRVAMSTSETNLKPVHMQELGATVEYGTGHKPSEIETAVEYKAIKAAEYSKTTPGPLQEQRGDSEAVLEPLPRAEISMASEAVTELRNLKETSESMISTDGRTQGPTVEYVIATRRTGTKKLEASLMTDVEEASETEKGMTAKYLEPAAEAGEVRLLERMKESATAEVEGSETVRGSEVHMDVQDLETSQKAAVINILEDASETLTVTKQHSEAIPEFVHTEKQEHLQAVFEARPTAEEAPETLSATEMKSSEAVPITGDAKDLETTLECGVAAEAQRSEVGQCQQMEDVRVPHQAQEYDRLVEKKDAEQNLASEPFVAVSGQEITPESVSASETAFSSSHSAGTPESMDTRQLEAAPACVAETKDLQATPVPETVVELKDAEAAPRSEADAKDLEAAPVPETVPEEVPVPGAEAGQSEVILPAETDKEVAAEEASEARDSETSDVQPDVAARMRETLMRLQKVEKSSHRSSEKSKHDAKKQKRSRSKSQSRSRKRKKKSRSRSTSRRLTSKRARSRSRNYSDSRKKHSKSRSRSVEKRERRLSSRRSRRRRSRSSDRYRSKSRSLEKTRRSGHRRSRSSDNYRSKSRSMEKRGSRLSSRRSRRRRSRSSDRYRSKSRSVEKRGSRLSSRRSRRRRSRSSDHYRSKSRSVEKTRRSGRRRSRSSDRYRSKSRSLEKTRRSGRRRSRSSDRYRSKSRSLEKTRRSGRRRSRSSDRYRSKSPSVEKRGSRLSSWRSRRRRSRSSDRSKSRSRSSGRRSDSRDRRISLRLRSRSRTPIRQRRSRSRGRRRSSSRSPIRLRRSRSSGRRRGYSRSPDRRRSRSSERFSSRSPKRLTDLDKAQLLEIAKANAAAMCAKSGVPLPPSLMPMLSQKKDDKASQKSSRDTLKELTEKCKKIAQSTDDVIVNKPHVSDEEEEERPFYNHPFKLNEPKPIFFNLSVSTSVICNDVV
uniref:SON DNA binding protein n=1 Tax=Anas platyrhynchos platyrhynchos TaxID=8840 RepID=A0A493SZN5_ANAPP